MPLHPHAVVIYVNGLPYGQSGPEAAQHSVGNLSAPKQAFDPFKVQREFPARWQAYIQANFRNIADVTHVFHVSEKTARNWWTGATGANGSHVAIAMNAHPEQAPRMLFAAE
jgi:hypothetical protein